MTFLKRDIKNELIAMSRSYPVVTLLGPRQSGKTTLVKSIFTNKPYVSLENPDDRHLAQYDARSFLEQYPHGAILDEIQRAPELLSYIQGIVDNSKEKGMFILTGSHQMELHQSISQSLAGRTALLKLLPFSLGELPELNQGKELDYYLYQGMYPRIYDDHLEPTKFYRSYIQTYVERDVRMMIHLRDLTKFQQFLKLCASRVGQLFNASSISNAIGVSHHTVEHWLSILEASFITFRLQPYFENFGKRIVKSSKLYFTDVGLATYLLDIHKQEQIARDPLRGNLVENFVVSEFIKNRLNKGLESNCYFYRDSNQREVDLLLKSANELIPVEIKSSKTFHPEFLKGLEYFKNLTGARCQRGYLIYAGNQTQKVKDFSIAHFSSIKEISNAID